VPDPFTGTCTTCHDTPNAGNHSVKAPLNIGLTDASRRTADMPLYTLRRLSSGDTVQTTDPGRAMVTGKWADIGKFKGPILRGLAARAPYFHNGFAASLDEVIDFYESRFNIGLTAQERSDLIAFLRRSDRRPQRNPFKPRYGRSHECETSHHRTERNPVGGIDFARSRDSGSRPTQRAGGSGQRGSRRDEGFPRREGRDGASYASLGSCVTGRREARWAFTMPRVS
jgi:hypothetical protein